MAMLLKGAPVAAALDVKTAAEAAALRARGVIPTLGILRVGEREDDLSYERSAGKRCEALGIDVRLVSLPADVESEAFFAALDGLTMTVPEVFHCMPPASRALYMARLRVRS